MAAQTNIDLEAINKLVALTGRVEQLKQGYLQAVPHLDAERAKYMTQAHRESEGEPLDIRRAKMFKRLMEGLTVNIKDMELIVGSQTKYTRGASPSIDYNPRNALELFESGKVLLSSLVRSGEVSDEEKESLIVDANYWMGKSPYDMLMKARRELFGSIIDDMEEARVFLGDAKQPVYSRLPDLEKVLRIGLTGVIGEAQNEINKLTYRNLGDVDKHNFLKSVIIACEGAISFAQRYSDRAAELAVTERNPIRKRELEQIAANLAWAPKNPARSFYEAIQSFWLVFLCVNLDAAYSNETPGRIDQILYPYYERDVSEGKLTRQEAAELLGCLWVKFAEMDNVRGKQQREASQANQTQDVTIGGVHAFDGTDASNELTYLILEVTKQLKTHQPPVYLRIHKNTPAELWNKALECNLARGDGMPAFLNDDAAILSLISKGIPPQEARGWVASACVKPDIDHASAAGVSCILSLAKVMELTLFNGKDPVTGKQLGPQTGDTATFTSFDQLYDAFKAQVDFFVSLLAKYHAVVWQVYTANYSSPFFSALTDDCIKRGCGYMNGGIRYPQLFFGIRDRGGQDATDSLIAVKKVVFTDKKITMSQLLEALSKNFDGEEKMRQMLIAAPKYGNDDEFADEIFNDLSIFVQRRIYEEKHIMGPFMSTNRSGATFHYYFGKTVGALPNGRKQFMALADGTLSPVQGMDVNGPTAVINSASKINHTEINRNTLLNMKIPPTLLDTKEGQRKFISLVKTYFNRGGYHIQFNLLDNKTLLDAKEHSENYRDLLVRVAGYSAYFVDLLPGVQDEIIARTAQAI